MVPPEVIALWSLGTGALASVVVQLLKKSSDLVATQPDHVKMVIAFLTSVALAGAGTFFGSPVPRTPAGFANALVIWAISMGLHALGKKFGLYKEVKP